MATHHNQFFNNSALTKVTLNKRLEDSAWGFFLLLIGTLLLLPSALVPQGAWLIGAGLIMLLLNGVRYVNDISVSRFTVVLGLVAILVGLASFLGLKPPLFAIFLALIGLSIIVRSLLPPKVDRRNR
jgi:hypothetical protein